MSGVGDLDLQRLWDYDDPAGSETRFRAVLEPDDLELRASTSTRRT